MTTEANWRVTDEMQRDFVAMSGDSNPLHTDALAARRLPFGRIAVHGMHLVLDTLDRAVAAEGKTPARITAVFRRPVGIDDELTTTTTSDASGAELVTRSTVWTDGRVAADIVIETGDVTIRSADFAPPPTAEADTVEPEDLADMSGTIALGADRDLLTRRFPALARVGGATLVAEMLGLTRMVGMHVPGLHSLFSSLDVRIGHDCGASGELDYGVRRYDDRFAQVTIGVTGPNIGGTVRAFVRPAPIEPSVGEVRPGTTEFAGQRWLVVGGSRGLGAVATLLLDAGGADVRCTYLAGADDAERLTRRTTRAASLHLDVADPTPALDALRTDGWWPTHLAYFASPPIFAGAAGTWSDALEHRFRAVYLDGAEQLVEALDGLQAVLWPSSEAVEADTPGLAEYARVKHEGEAWCRALTERGLRCHAPRFPRLRTDQTASFVPVEYGDAPAEVLAALRATVHDG